MHKEHYYSGLMTQLRDFFSLSFFLIREQKEEKEEANHGDIDPNGNVECARRKVGEREEKEEEESVLI